MTIDYRYILFAALACSTVIFTIFLFPALTSRDDLNFLGPNHADLKATVSQELLHCQTRPSDIDCQCFASISGAILADNKPRIPGAWYFNKRDLARGQAADSC